MHVIRPHETSQASTELKPAVHKTQGSRPHQNTGGLELRGLQGI